MEKVMNFRDLGGIETADGRHVKSGLFFRSAFLDEATEADINYLRSLGIKKIFDYRDVAEVNKDNEIKYKRIGSRHSHFPNNITKGAVYKLQNGGLNRAFIKIRSEDVCEFYSYLPIKNTGYAAMAESLENGEVPFLQHCTAGKDRAGIGTAILLGILGVPYENILADYLKSLQIENYIREKMLWQIPWPLSKILGRNYAPLFIVDKTYLDAAFDAIRETYGTFESYLFEEFGLSDRKIKKIRDLYTE